MRQLALLLWLILPFAAQAQFIAGKPTKEYTTKQGTTFHPGDTIYLALGTRENGSFKYAEIPPGHLIMPEGMPLPSAWNNRKVVLKEIRSVPYKTGPAVSLIFKAGIYNAKIDPDAAEQAGEIITARNNKPIPATEVKSVADELIKLKSLLDAGVITQAEFDAQKKKLLNSK